MDSSNVTYRMSFVSHWREQSIYLRAACRAKTHRAVVNTSDQHVSLEDTIFDLIYGVAFLDLLVEVLVQPPGLVSSQGSVEVGFAALLSRG